jgi:hypothetical protein
VPRQPHCKYLFVMPLESRALVRRMFGGCDHRDPRCKSLTSLRHILRCPRLQCWCFWPSATTTPDRHWCTDGAVPVTGANLSRVVYLARCQCRAKFACARPASARRSTCTATAHAPWQQRQSIVLALCKSSCKNRSPRTVRATIFLVFYRARSLPRNTLVKALWLNIL